ncbi:MAG: hypothetical protein AB1515_04225 [Nitrospirota bacterium]
MSASGFHRLAPLALALCWWLGAATAVQGGERVQLAVDVIYADQSSRGVDPQVGRLRSELQRFKGYSTYRAMGRHVLNLSVGDPGGQPGHVMLPGGKVLVLIPQGISGKAVVLLASIQEGGHALLNSQLKLADGGTILVGGPVYEDGVLILAIGATLR